MIGSTQPRSARTRPALTRPAQTRSTLRDFVGAVLDGSVAQLSPSLARRASAVVWDTVSMAWLARTEPEVQALAPLAIGGGRSSSVIGNGALVTAESAAFVNGTAAVWCETDEGFRGAGHPGAHAVTAGVAMAEELSSTGSELLIAVLRGYELQASLGLAMTLRPEVHAHGALGAPAAALTAASLLGLDADRATHAVNIAANLAPAGLWLSCLGGDTVRNTFAGTGAQVGIRSALLAAGGMTAPAESCDIGYGIVRGTAFDGWPQFDGSWALSDGYLKQWSACAYAHTTLDAAEALAARGGGAEIAEVTVRVPEVGALLSPVLFEPPLAVRFSIPALVALLLSGGDMRDPRTAKEVVAPVRDLAARVHIVEDADMTATWPQNAMAAVVVRYTDGTEDVEVRADPITPNTDDEFVTAVAAKAARLHGWPQSVIAERIEDLVQTPAVSTIFPLPNHELEKDEPQASGYRRD